MHYFASIKSDTCAADNCRLEEMDIGYMDCGGNCIRIVQWSSNDMAQEHVELTPKMTLALIDALVKWRESR